MGRKKTVRAIPAQTKQNKDVEIVRKEQVRAGLDALEMRLANNKPAQAALQEVTKLYTAERSYLIQRAETTENLAGVGLSVETASHDIMSVMKRGLRRAPQPHHGNTEGRKPLNRIHHRELISLRRERSNSVEAQLRDIQQLFKSSKQRRKYIRVKDTLQKVAKLFDMSLKKDNVQLNIAERGSPLIAKNNRRSSLAALLEPVRQRSLLAAFQARREAAD